MTKKQSDGKIQLTWQADNALPGEDSDSANPLARAVQQLLNEGRPFERLAKCFFRGPDGIQRWFGIFVLSAGNRVVFFPGYSEIPRGISGAPGASSASHRVLSLTTYHSKAIERSGM